MKLAILFPGIGYNNDKPLLYYSGKLFKSHEFEVVKIEYSNLPSDVFSNKDSFNKCLDLVYEQTCNQLKKIDFASLNGDDDLIFFVGKSIGTVAAARYAKENNLTVGQIILTPLKQTIDYLENGCNLVFHGDDDRWADSDEINMLCAMKHIETFTIPDANHSLEVGDIGEDIDNLNEIISLIENYISDYE